MIHYDFLYFTNYTNYLQQPNIRYMIFRAIKSCTTLNIPKANGLYTFNG
jgi:hypothetical protein